MTAIFCVGPFTRVKNSHSSRGITLRYYFCAIQTLKHFPDKIYPYFFNYPISSPSNLQRINWWYFIFFGLITHTSNAMHCLYCFDNRKPSIKCDKFWAMFILRLVRENFIKSVSRRCWSCAPLLVAKNNWGCLFKYEIVNFADEELFLYIGPLTGLQKNTNTSDGPLAWRFVYLNWPVHSFTWKPALWHLFLIHWHQWL